MLTSLYPRQSGKSTFSSWVQRAMQTLEEKCRSYKSSLNPNVDYMYEKEANSFIQDELYSNSTTSFTTDPMFGEEQKMLFH